MFERTAPTRGGNFNLKLMSVAKGENNRLHIVCCVKQVPDTAQVKIDPETNTLIRSGVESICNPYDLIAAEGYIPTFVDGCGGR